MVYILFLLNSIEGLRFIGTRYCITKSWQGVTQFSDIVWRQLGNFLGTKTYIILPVCRLYLYCTLVCRLVDMTKAAALFLYGCRHTSLASRLVIMRNTTPLTRHYCIRETEVMMRLDSRRRIFLPSSLRRTN
jgi:hypothetical protein